MKRPLIISRSDVYTFFTPKSIRVSRPISLKAFNKALKDKKELIIAYQYEREIEKPKYKDITEMGILVQIQEVKYHNEEKTDIEFKFDVISTVALIKNEEDNEKVINKTEIEFEILDEILNESLITSDVDLSDIQKERFFELKQLFLNKNNALIRNTSLIKNIDDFPSSVQLIILLESIIWNDYTLKVEFFECYDNEEKLEFLEKILASQIPDENKQELDNEINAKLNKMLSKQQKEFYLREKLRIIKEELGDISNREDDADDLRNKVKNQPFPKNIKEKLLSEISRYETSFNSNESGIIKTYIEWLMSIPWWQLKEDKIDVSEIEKKLNENHYGIEKVKERIIEYIASYKANPNSKSPIICLVGPPGVGKTSLAKSIAEALDKVYVKISLGGVKDESEIRGHRRTYLGAMPGRIIKAMKKAGVINPLILLDEIDKISNDQKGDPASALLEVLDPEQNKLFSDNYIEEEYDLSKVMFICTANYYERIPEPLLDRLEIIEISSYTVKEKKYIAKHHLIPRNLENVKLNEKTIKFNDDAIEFMINCYTREAGVRELDRVIQKIIRKVLVNKFKVDKKTFEVNIELVKEYLGKIKYDYTQKDKIAIPGVVNGMAYTSAGGDLLPIEATFFSGKGNIIITGNLEKTMSESVNVAFGYVKANVEKFGIKDIDFSKLDLHLHVPSGGIPKDGPSAGIAITTAIISALKNEPIDTTISMTGEIMLRGNVGIIGGVKEKVISAHRGGVRTIFMPKDDERFISDIPEEVLKDVKIHLVEKYNEVYNKIFKKN